MAAALEPALRELVLNCKLLVVGAGGIGCELLKNLVLSGFCNITVVDLDTIDVSNLNRQFLFRKEHVGKSKAIVARESALSFNPDTNITAIHDSITSSKYDVEFYKGFSLVMNALDNRAARNHVNRMCLAADITLVESGTAGYLGQVTVIRRGYTECYECQPKPRQTTFPGCTIRNTPSEPVHCIVWAKHLFNQLFGEDDPDQDVSPDTEDPEAVGEAGDNALKSSKDKMPERKSTKLWCQEINYDAQKLFNKFFSDDIKYLLSMANLWKERRQPIPLDWNNLPSDTTEQQTVELPDQRVWSLAECCRVFQNSVCKLMESLKLQGDGGTLIWDKDDDIALDFVVSTANIRSFVFGISLKSKFDTKSMAGNIIPAIATTNAIIAGAIVMEGFKVLQQRFSDCKTVYLNVQPNNRKKLLVPCDLDKPNPKCYVCAEKPEITVALDVNHCSIQTLLNKILKNALGMIAPDVEIEGTGCILISSEEGETDDNLGKMLTDFNLKSGSRLCCDDFLQAYNLVLSIQQKENIEEEFLLFGDLESMLASASKEADKNEEMANADVKDDDDDLQVVDNDNETNDISLKRKLAPETNNIAKKQKKTEDVMVVDDDDVILL